MCIERYERVAQEWKNINVNIRRIIGRCKLRRESIGLEVNKASGRIDDFMNSQILWDINKTAASLMEEKLRDIQKELAEIIGQAMEYKKQGNHIILSGYLAGGIMRLNRNIESVLEMVEMVKEQAG
jgi:hypothetical protein